eukprot:825409-Prorocentrum_minimum.AAC.1
MNSRVARLKSPSVSSAASLAAVCTALWSYTCRMVAVTTRWWMLGALESTGRLGSGADVRGYGVDVTEVDNTRTPLVRDDPRRRSDGASGFSDEGLKDIPGAGTNQRRD